MSIFIKVWETISINQLLITEKHNLIRKVISECHYFAHQYLCGAIWFEFHSVAAWIETNITENRNLDVNPIHHPFALEQFYEFCIMNPVKKDCFQWSLWRGSICSHVYLTVSDSDFGDHLLYREKCLFWGSLFESLLYSFLEQM